MTHDIDKEDGHLPDAVRWELRALRKDVAPQADLWPSIAARIAATPQVAPAPQRKAWQPIASLAAAASLALAIGIAWQVRPVSPSDVPAASSTQPRIIAREAEAMTLEYQAALKEIDAYAPQPAKAAPELKVLDRSAAQIRTALTRDPDARFLLDRLQRTYTRRLELTQRLARTSLAS
ncbi:hypothetical protein LF41_960 [Lysobacter dokdonensis DS-58]|uniref:Uncharacterized protein n=1 Tax=Lysobacter dokdonensis DS-58 TaxID=1300345 RepID=A0A0A2WKT0_9GAMM|nr:hypothetical protein [Lysobacter dokdonensis]KGQ20423.1 hypothetical protein LF41_960 [Lysobacter dokdonensis DS-58]